MQGWRVTGVVIFEEVDVTKVFRKVQRASVCPFVLPREKGWLQWRIKFQPLRRPSEKAALFGCQSH